MFSPTLRCTCAALTAWLLLPVSVHAQEPRPLTLKEALTLARERAPALLEASARVEEARGSLQGARALLSTNPTLDVEVGRRTTPGTPGAQSDWAVGLSQTLEVGGKRGARRAGAEAGLAAAQAARADAERRLLGEVAQAFAAALHAGEALALAEEGLQAAEALARATEARAAAGGVAAVDVNLARIARARARGDVALARAARAAALGGLEALLGLEAGAVPGVEGSLEALALAPPPADADASAPSPARPDIAALEAEVAQAEAAVRTARAEGWPDVTLGARSGREGEESLVTGLLSLPLPLFQRGRGAHTSALAQAARARLALQAAQRGRAVELARARAAHAAAAEALEALRTDAQPLAQENLALSTRAWEAGEMGFSELLLVRRDALETRALYLTRLLEAAHARAQLATQLGVTP